ncbi:MAG: DUF6518 family protein [Jatrophihabitans sp.]|uniref:DUF6518 family protein n=1 Tax=Jatrophihabitans sp. TaxID=1932789 RepID=UPI003F820E9A
MPATWQLTGIFAAGLAIGVATSWLQGVLPAATNFLANSGAVWAVAAFLLSVMNAPTPVRGAVAGLLSLLGEVLGYYAIASPLRGIATTSSERGLWISAAVVIGPLVGACAHYARHGAGASRAAAPAAVCGIVIGEGMYAVLELANVGQGASEVGVAGAAAAVVTVRAASGTRHRATAVVTTLAAAIVVLGLYWLSLDG